MSRNKTMRHKMPQNRRFSNEAVVDAYIMQRTKNLAIIAADFDRTVPQISQIIDDALEGGYQKCFARRHQPKTKGLAGGAL